MSTCPPISFPPRTGHTGSDVFQAVVAIVRNRTGRDYHAAFNQTLRANGDLLQAGYDHQGTTRNFCRLTNRVENRSGLSAVKSTERSADDAGALARRFIPPLAFAPSAMQWDVLWRAAEELDRAGVPERLFNRGPEGVTQSDWSAATGRADAVFALLDFEATSAVDRGPILQYAKASQIRGVFRSAVERLMRDQLLTRRAAFDRLKEDEPIFWTMAMLSFEPES